MAAATKPRLDDPHPIIVLTGVLLVCSWFKLPVEIGGSIGLLVAGGVILRKWFALRRWKKEHPQS
jgi:hypothetical protein